MPNHCYQQVTITGPRALISQIEDNLKCKEARFCDLIAPMPFEIWVEADVKITKPVNTTLPSWYEWRNENWGTKWDVCAVEMGDIRLKLWNPPAADRGPCAIRFSKSVVSRVATHVSNHLN